MPSLVEQEIITELRESGEDFENIILGTYSLETRFFEEELLKVFQQKDAKRIVLMVDGRHYDETFKAARNAGIMYLIEPVFLRADFHAKFLLMTSEETGKLLVGSANLTENGLTRSGEVFTFVDSDLAKEYPDILSVFAEMKDFLTALSKKRYIRSKNHEEQIINSLEVPWLADAEITEKRRRRIRLLHSIEKPILFQLKNMLDNDEVTKITITSPFFDLDGRVLDYLVDNFCNNIQIYIQPDYVQNFPVKKIKNLQKKENGTSTFRIAFKNDVNRYIHAKIILLETDKGCYCLSGSANATKAGLLSSAKIGNIELCLLRYEKQRKAFDYLLFNNQLETNKVSVSSLSSNPSKRDLTPSPDIYLEEARLKSNDLVIKFSPSVGRMYKHAELTISRPVSVKPITIKQVLSNKSRLTIGLDDISKRFCEQSSFVTLALRKRPSKKPLLSNKRWISTEVLEHTPRRRDVAIIEKSNGRRGLIRLMNQLDKASEIPTMLLYYLQYLDFDWLAESLESSRKRIARRTVYEGEPDDESIPFERYLLSADEVLEKIVARHDKRFERLTKEIKKVEDLQTRSLRIFDLFLFMNKIIIWFIIKKDVGIEELSDIVHRMELLVGTNERFWYRKRGFGYFDRLREVVGKKEFLKMYKQLDVLPHFIVLSKIVHDLGRRYLPRDERLYLSERLCATIENACATDNRRKEISSLSKERLMRVAEEYEEYEEFFFSHKGLSKHALTITVGKETLGKCNDCGKKTFFRISSDTHLCPKCAKKKYRRMRTRLVLKQCHARKCGYTKWMLAHGTPGLVFCEKDGMRMITVGGKFYIPRYM